MLKLRFSKPFIRQYMDDKITVCKYECVIMDNDTKEVKEKFTATGYAKCAPEDTVNAEFGRKLADSRAKYKAYQYASNILCPECLDTLVERVNEGIQLLDFIDTMLFLKKKEITHIKDVCNEAV